MTDDMMNRTLAQCAAAAKKAGIDYNLDIDTLQAHIELASRCSPDPELRGMIEELGRLENLIELSPSSMKPFLLDSRKSFLKRIHDELIKLGRDDCKRILSILKKRDIS